MQAVRTPVLGIALAVLLLVGETIGLRAYVAARRPTAADATSMRRARLLGELQQLEVRVRMLSTELARLRVR